MPYNEYGLDFVLNSFLHNINGDIFDTANEILLGYSAVMNVAGNFRKCSLLALYICTKRSFKQKISKA